ncbi:hypothetical protein AA0242T_2441 [Acetobacter aceti NRIC 0242]|uniref:Uncharacterized protein n=1 Tax=Acetobacter aceti NBRC 14818 TaxID=887700 RepID=A0AB33IFF5_ACEAC|nr:hypothetical protein [Acetobacter aceti]TCS30764.1 hypothetical protein EDC15_11920 [Acetobacter aceti NBRC 14818]BCK75918.1 hypothetical protein EMQ_1524 [Acetobacter aceti NBRC 14818]GAN58519.1 hypothetical protein Abac_055_041 [Acetobacter aceti NBRC 14818]GBO81739.1 hypothetical protein AA0242T_2441 [Acetobacter aceti NRIC 0242]
MEFQNHHPDSDVRQPATQELAELRACVSRFASTDPVIIAWAGQCASNLAEEDQTTEDMIRLSATVLKFVLDLDLQARAAVKQSLPAEWCVSL